MGGGGGNSFSNFIDDTIDRTRRGLSDFEDSGLDSTAAYLINPLIAQDIAGSSLASGEGSRSYMNAAGQALSNPGKYLSDPRNQLELAQFNASLLAGGAGAVAAAPASLVSPLGAVTIMGGTGLAAGTATQATGNALGTGQGDAAVADAQASAMQEREAAAARAAAIAGLPKDPTVDEIARQRRARGGRRGTILTTPGQSLGSTGQGKTLLGL